MSNWRFHSNIVHVLSDSVLVMILNRTSLLALIACLPSLQFVQHCPKDSSLCLNTLNYIGANFLDRFPLQAQRVQMSIGAAK